MTVSIAGAQGYVLYQEPKQAAVAEVHGYTLSKAPLNVAVRQIAGYAVVALPSPIQTRQIAGYAIVSDGGPITGKTGRDAIFDAIIFQSKITRPKSHFILGQPEAAELTVEGLTYNTRIKLAATLASKLRGEMYFYYNRSHIRSMVKVPANVRVIGATTTHDLIASINTATGSIITTDDIVNEPIPADTDWCEVTAAATSHMFVAGTKSIVGQKPVVTDPFLLFDTVSMTDLTGRNPTLTLTNAAVDNTYLIDGEPTVKIENGGALALTLNEAFDTSVPEWTLEWSSRLNASSVAYNNLMVMSAGSVTAFVQRQADSGFGGRIQQGYTTANAGSVNNFPFGSAAKNGVLTRYAAVKNIDGTITMFVDGKPTMLANGTGTTYSVKSFYAGANLGLMTRIALGALAQNIGSFRLTKKALYKAEYIPRPLKQVAVDPTFDSFIPVGKLDGFQPQE